MPEISKPGLTVVSSSALSVAPAPGSMASASATSGQEVRCAVRFPLTLPVLVHSHRRKHTALTRNVSASGVLFEMSSPLRVGDRIAFSLRMPGAVLGTPHDVLVDCCGRVVRCSQSQAQSHVAATIDDYQFVEQ
ncbi:MAG TPA: PilZ domain-containing protein [Terracidiphilus sp.]|jgi:hypothetical protein|nr:PilZ domain-containing protein [Terracidiphilus sp.]